MDREDGREIIEHFGQALADALRALVLLVLSLLTQVLHLLRVAFDALRGAAILIVRVACVGVAVFGVASVAMPIWAAFGGDLPALLPAVALLVLPFAFVLDNGAGFGGVLLAGVAVVLVGASIDAIAYEIRMLLIAVLIGACVVSQMQRTIDNEKQG